MNISLKTKQFRNWVVILAFVPLVIAGLYTVAVNIHLQYRYDEQYFTDEYKEHYQSPGSTAIGLEEALKTGNASKYNEITGLKKAVQEVDANPDLIMTILLDVDDAGYFHYLYLDMQTYRRSMAFIKEVSGRWVVVPEDPYYYWDSGRWWDVYLPIAITWWSVLAVVVVGRFLFQVGARSRAEMHR